MPDPQFSQATKKIEANQSLDFTAFLASLDQSQTLRGIRVVFWDGFSMHVVRQGPPLCGRDQRAVVIKPDIGEVTLRDTLLAERRESKFYTELTNVGIGCGGVLAAWAVAGTTAAATPITGGASLVVTNLAVVAGYAGIASCANSSVRLANEVWHPEWNDWLDEEWMYVGMSNALDAIGIIGATAATATTIKLAVHLRNTTGKSMLKVLEGLTRQQRKALMEELIRTNNPGISNSALKMFVRLGKVPKRYTPMQIEHSVRRQLGDAFGALLNFSGSAYDGLINKGYSATTQEPAKPKQPSAPLAYGSYVVGLAESFDSY